MGSGSNFITWDFPISTIKFRTAFIVSGNQVTAAAGGVIVAGGAASVSEYWIKATSLT